MKRTLGVFDAVVIGLGSMIGAGIFAALGPAAAAAGSGLLIGLALAAVVAYCNATSSARLAALYPQSGGTYVYGRERLGDFWGYTAGWSFIVGKTASCAAMALTVGAYVWPQYAHGVAVGAVLALTAVNYAGVQKSALLTRIIVATVLGVLAAVVVTLAGAGEADRLSIGADADAWGVLQAAGLLFFAFAGYARMATLGEEVVEPRRTLPRAIFIALGIVLVLYASVAVLLISTLGVNRLALSTTPLADVLAPAWTPLVVIIAGIACLGSLVGILAGLSRTSLAMARERDLPGLLARVSPRTSAPIVAEGLIATLAVVIVVLLEPAHLVAASSAAVLLYYAVAHLSALRQPPAERWQPRAVAIAGLVGCVVLVAALPPLSILGTACLLAVGLVLRMLAVRLRARSAPEAVAR